MRGGGPCCDRVPPQIDDVSCMLQLLVLADATVLGVQKMRQLAGGGLGGCAPRLQGLIWAWWLAGALAMRLAHDVVREPGQRSGSLLQRRWPWWLHGQCHGRTLGSTLAGLNGPVAGLFLDNVADSQR